MSLSLPQLVSEQPLMTSTISSVDIAVDDIVIRDNVLPSNGGGICACHHHHLCPVSLCFYRMARQRCPKVFSNQIKILTNASEKF